VRSQDQLARYRDLVAAARKQAETLERHGIDPPTAARVIADAWGSETLSASADSVDSINSIGGVRFCWPIGVGQRKPCAAGQAHRAGLTSTRRI
jgi:hypothetical protein